MSSGAEASHSLQAYVIGLSVNILYIPPNCLKIMKSSGSLLT